MSHIHIKPLYSPADASWQQRMADRSQALHFDSGDAQLDALRTQLAQRLNLINPHMLHDMDADELRQLVAELDADEQDSPD